jgi:integrase
MARLGEEDGTGALALRFTILTAARTNEIVGATWGEIDMTPPRRVAVSRDEKDEPIIETTGATWTVPGDRMKAGKEHRVPLSEPALAVLREAAKQRKSESPDAPVFPGGKGSKSRGSLSNMSMCMLLRRIGRGDLTVHGFRSTFRDWAAERTSYQREVVEAALAHTIESKVEAAYRRGDLFEKRRRLMTEWATFCERAAAAEGADVVPLRGEAVA